jgi:ribosomal protein L40E
MEPFSTGLLPLSHVTSHPISQAMFVEVFPPRWLFVAAVVVLVILVTASGRRQRRRMRTMFDVNICPRCGANEPPHAMFCGTCGTRMRP